MAWCPICRKEYDNNIDVCPQCNEALIDQIKEIASTDEDSLNLLRGSGKTYVAKEDQYRDLTSTVWTFMFFGIAGLIFVFLNLIGILDVLHGFLPNLVMSALFIFFLWVGISTHYKAKTVQLEIDDENRLTEQINQWLKEHITEEFLKENYDTDESAEVNYMRISDKVKELLIDAFGTQDGAYLDKLYEDYYNNHFE
jgi:hypothetical protein